MLLRVERGTLDPAQLPVSSRARLAYLVLQRHNWGQHALCGRLPELLQVQDIGLGCEAPRPATVDLW